MAGSKYMAVYACTMASGATLSSEVNLSGGWPSAYLEIPTLTSNTEHRIKVANASGGNYRQVYHPPINSSTSSNNMFKISSALTQALVPIPGGVQFIKIETTATVDDGAVYRIIVGDL